MAKNLTVPSVGLRVIPLLWFLEPEPCELVALVALVAQLSPSTLSLSLPSLPRA